MVAKKTIFLIRKFRLVQIIVVLGNKKIWNTKNPSGVVEEEELLWNIHLHVLTSQKCHRRNRWDSISIQLLPRR